MLIRLYTNKIFQVLHNKNFAVVMQLMPDWRNVANALPFFGRVNSS